MSQNIGMTFLVTLLICALALSPLSVSAQDQAFAQLEERLAEIDEQMPGRIGVYIKSLKDGQEINYRTDREWYLASTIKIPLAIAVLKKVETGDLSLTQEVELAESDFVDGSGDLLYHDPGSKHTVDQLIKRSTENSDSTATDMLIRLLGEEEFNEILASAIAAEGFNPITTIVRVRHDAYSEIHSGAAELTNLDFIELRAAGPVEARYELLLEKLGIDPDDVEISDVNEAFERYYQRGLNSGDLAAMGLVLERLVKGEYLDEDNTERLLQYMRNVDTGDGRIKAGLPANTEFAHKTGTQIDRSCNVGILNSRTPDDAVIVAACAEGYGSLNQAETAFARLGRALNDAGLVQ